MTRSPLLTTAAPATDAALLAAAARGDRSALGELACRYVDFVYASAARQLADRHAAEDVTQAVFLVLAKKAGHVRAPALAAWLHRTTVYAAANARRAARRRRRHERAAARPEADMSADPNGPHASKSSDAATHDLLARLDTAIAALPAKDRIAVCNRYLRGDDLAAVARALGTTPAAAQKRVERAVETLRRRLDATNRTSPGVGRPIASATLLAALTLAAPSPANAAPAAFALAATPAATSVAKGVIFMTLSSKLKVAAVAVLAVLIGGAGIEAVRRAVVAPPTAPAPLASLNATSPPAAPAGSSGGMVAAFADGVTTALIAVGDMAADEWWTPDGRPTPRPPGLRRAAIDLPASPNPTDRWLTFVTATNGPSGRATGRGDVVSDAKVVGWVSSPEGELLLTAVSLSADPATVDWHTDVAADGPQTARLRPDETGHWKPSDVVELTSPGGKTYRLSDATEQNGRADFTLRPFVSGRQPDEVTVTLFDAAGRDVWAGQQPVEPPGGGMILRYHAVEKPLAGVAAAELSLRHYDRWAEFRGVSTRAGTPATPTVVTSEAVAARTAVFADGVAVELIAIGEPAAGQWWTPDGGPIAEPSGVKAARFPSGPAPGERRLAFVTEVRNAGGHGTAIGRLEPSPGRMPWMSWQAYVPNDLVNRDVTLITIDPADEWRGFHVDVAAAVPLTVTLRPPTPGQWNADAAVELQSPGGLTYTMSRPHEREGHPAFDVSPYLRDVFRVDDLNVTLIGPRGEDSPCARDPVDNAKSPKLEAWSNQWRLADVTEARLTLTRYDRGADFLGVALRPGAPATVRAVVHEPPRGPAK